MTLGLALPHRTCITIIAIKYHVPAIRVRPNYFLSIYFLCKGLYPWLASGLRMAGPSRVYLFGDQTANFDSGLRRLLQAKNDSLVSSFFQKCYYALRKEISQLPPSQRQMFPRFTSIVDLLARYRESGPSTALESALTTIYQLGCFIQ